MSPGVQRIVETQLQDTRWTHIPTNGYGKFAWINSARRACRAGNSRPERTEPTSGLKSLRQCKNLLETGPHDSPGRRTAGAGGGQSPARFKGPIVARFTRAPAGGGGAARGAGRSLSCPRGPPSPGPVGLRSATCRALIAKM